MNHNQIFQGTAEKTKTDNANTDIINQITNIRTHKLLVEISCRIENKEGVEVETHRH